MFLTDSGYALIAVFNDKSVTVHSWSVDSETLLEAKDRVLNDLGVDEEAPPPVVQVVPVDLLSITQDMIGITHAYTPRAISAPTP